MARMQRRHDASAHVLRWAAVGAVAVLAMTGCAQQPDEQPFDAWSSEMHAALATGTGPGGGAADGGWVGLDVGEPGEWSVVAACRGAESTTIEVSSDDDVVAELDVTCDASSPVTITLPSAEALMTVDDDVDWYVVFNR